MPKVQKPIRLKQLALGHFHSADGTGSYSTLGLGVDGKVYRYDPKCEGWIPWPMDVVDCRMEHRGRR